MSTGVRELTEGFGYQSGERGISATRVYIWSNGSSDNETIPNIGEAFAWPMTLPTGIFSNSSYEASSFSTLVVKTRDIKILNSDKNTLQFTVTYGNEIVDDAIYILQGVSPTCDTKIEDLPKTLEFGGEYTTIDPTDATDWVWTGGNAVSQPLSQKVNTTALKITRYIDYDYLNIFSTKVKEMSGCVNSIANCFGTAIGGGIGCWLFNSVSTEEFANQYDKRYLKADLEFLYRDPDFSDSDGWQKVMRADTGVFDTPTSPTRTPNKLYKEVDLRNLFTNYITYTPCS